VLLPLADPTLELIREALERLGVHPHVPISVRSASVSDYPPAVCILLEMRFLAAHPVCCPELGCYSRFLGLARAQVPLAIAAALTLDSPPRVHVEVKTLHERGFRYLSFGHPNDAVVAYGHDHFVTDLSA
jgi:hypothetical protein